MKHVKNFGLAVLLACFLAVSAPAGEIGMPGIASPAPTPSPHGASSSDPAKSALNQDPDGSIITVETSDYLFYEALAALLSVF